MITKDQRSKKGFSVFAFKKTFSKLKELIKSDLKKSYHIEREVDLSKDKIRNANYGVLKFQYA